MAIAALSGLLAPRAGAAQAVTSAIVTGAVRDGTGAVLAGVVITATNLDTNVVREGISDTDGRYVMAGLDPAPYRVSAALSGFATGLVERLTLAVGESASLDFQLDVAGVTERVVVVARTPAVDTRRTDPASVVSREQIAALPLARRSYIGLSVINAGLVEDRTPAQGVSRNSGISIHGQRARSNNVLIDGLDNNGMTTGSVRGVFSQDAVQEFQLLPSAYSAEFGQASAGTLNIVTASGSNQLSATAVLLRRGTALNARGHFERFDPAGQRLDRDKAPFGETVVGGTIGGPVRAGRTFFFGSFEMRRAGSSRFVAIAPDTAALLGTLGFPVETGYVEYDDAETQAMGKVSHNWRPGHDLAVRVNYSRTTDEGVEAWGGLFARSNGIVDRRRDWAVAASQTDLLGRWLTDLRLQTSSQVIGNRALDPTCGGPCADPTDGGPLVEVIGQATAGRHRIAPNPVDERLFQVKAAASRLGSTHLFRAGLDFKRVVLTSSLPLHFGGRYIFAPLPAIPALGLAQPISSTQALALGLPAAYIQGFGNPDYDQAYTYVSLFAQDEWQVSPRVLLKFGLRYQVQLLPGTTYRIDGLDEPFTVPSDWNDLAPRVSIGIDPTGESRLHLRAAYGVFFDQNLGAALAVPAILDGRDGVRTLVTRFPSSVGAWMAPDRRTPEPPSYPSLQFALDPGLRTPYAHHTSLGVDRALSDAYSVSADVSFVRGRHQLGTIDYNPVLPALGPGRRPLDVNGVAGTSASVLQYTSYAETWYKGLDLSLRRRFRDGYGLTLAYTLSSAEDLGVDFQSFFLPQDNGAGRRGPDDTGLPLGFDPMAERGPSSSDQRHRLVASGTTRLPWALQLSGIISVASGLPYNIMAGVDLNGDGDGGGLPQDRARRLPGDPSSSLERNAGRLPATARVDMRVSRRFGPMTGPSVELLAEVFNLFNRTNVLGVNNVFGTGAFPDDPLPTYGQFTVAGSPRQAQLGVRVSY